MGKEEVRIAGCHLCWNQCEVQLHIEDGILTGARGNPGSAVGGGYSCERLSNVTEFYYSSRRLNYPQRRVGKRGEDKWERITWDEALDEIAEKLLEIRENHGPEAVAKIAGTIHGPGDWASWRFFNYWGSPNTINTGKNCGQANTTVECAMYGWDCYDGISFISKSRNVVLWGSNLPETRMLNWHVIHVYQKQGLRVLSVDSRYSEAASYADLWLQPRPGTDGALGWSIINVLIAEDLYDHEFVENWCTGFDEVAEKAKKYPPEVVEKITGVPAAKIRIFARYYAEGPTSFCWCLAGCHHGDKAGYSTAYTQAVIRAITGNIDREGGNPLSGPVTSDIDWYRTIGWDKLAEHLEQSDRDSLTAKQFPICSKQSFKNINESIKKAWGVGYSLPLYFLWPSSRGIYDAMRSEGPYPVKALFIQGGNPLLTFAGARGCHDAMKQVELLVGMDFFMTPSMAMCDYVLPAASWLERSHTMLFWGLAGINPVYEQPLPALHDRKDDYFLWSELARRVDLEGEWPETLEGMYDLLLRPSGKTLKEWARNDPHYLTNETGFEFERYRSNSYGFGTPSGKCELAPSNLAAAGLDPVPDYAEPPISKGRSPEIAAEFPLILVSGARVRPYWHSSYRELRSMRWRHELPEAQVHPETARAFGIINGDTIYIETPLGSIRQRALVTPAVDPNVIYAEAFWYYPEQPAEEPWLHGVWESNINAIIPDDYEYCDFAGDHPFRGTLCRISKAERPLDYEVPVFQEFEWA